MAEGQVLNVGGGGGAALPTAPLGQVLISQGAGTAPIFSDNPLVTLVTIAGGGMYGQNMQTHPQGTASIGGLAHVGGTMRLIEGTFATRNGDTVGNLANISDSTVNTVGATVAGGGSFHVLARWNGLVWKVVA